MCENNRAIFTQRHAADRLSHTVPPSAPATLFHIAYTCSHSPRVQRQCQESRTLLLFFAVGVSISEMRRQLLFCKSKKFCVHHV